MKQRILLAVICCIAVCGGGGIVRAQAAVSPIGIAVEYNNHAASAYIARSRGYYREAGLHLSIYESYATGTALAAALARGDIQVAYICLVPAINAFANAGVPIRIVAGTHKYGYGLAVDPQRIQSIADFSKPGIRLGCVQAGSAADILLHKIVDRFGLNRKAVLRNLQRMKPSRQILAARLGRLDAVFVPEHWATLSEAGGFQMFLTARDTWPGMQGSVLVVKEELLSRRPEVVKKLVHVLRTTTAWVHDHPFESASLLAEQLLQPRQEDLTAGIQPSARPVESSLALMRRSMQRLEYTTDIDPAVVQHTIDYLALRGYIRSSFKAERILDLRFLKQ